MEKAPCGWGRGTQRTGFHVGHIAVLTPTRWADFDTPKHLQRVEESYLLHSGTQRGGGTRKEIRNSSWRTETETRSPAKRRAAEVDGVPPAGPAIQSSTLEPGQGSPGSVCPVSFSWKQGANSLARWFVFKRKEDFGSTILPFEFIESRFVFLI